MGTKGDWKRPTDPRFAKQAKENKERLEKGKCRLNHMHDEECTSKMPACFCTPVCEPLCDCKCHKEGK